MALGNLIGFMFMIGLIAFIFMLVSSTVDDMILTCEESEENITSDINTACALFSEESPSSLIFLNKILFFMFFIIPLYMMYKLMFGRSPFRGLLYSIGEIFESFETGRDNNNEDDDEKEQYLKDTKTKLKKELNRKSFKSNQEPKRKGVQWGSGVELGNGMEDYEMKGGDK